MDALDTLPVSEAPSGVARPTSQDRAAAFIDAGFRRLDEAGLQGLSVRAVLRETGYNRKSFYAHFADKDQLILAVFARSIELATSECHRIVAASADPLRRLELIVRYIVTSGSPGEASTSASRRSAALCREHMRLAEAQPIELKRVLRPLIGLFAEQLSAGMAVGLVRADEPDALADLVYNLVSTTVHAATLAGEAGSCDRDDLKRLADRIWDFCRRGIVP